jgi:cellulose synthase (UDP-forming)
VYTILNVKVPYIPTPKEGKVKNEWLLCVPNLILAFLCIAAAISSLTVQGVRGPYTKLMATLALINATILLLSVLMAQHALLNSLRSFLWTTPVLHNIKKWVDDMLDAGSGVINKSLRSGSITFAAGLAVFNILASVGVVLVQWHEQVAVSDNYIWTHSGFGPLKVGPPEISKLSLDNTNHSLITWAKSPSATSQLVELKLPSTGALKVPVGVIEKINQQGNIPLLTWNADEKSPEKGLFQQQVAQLIARNNHLMLRPLIHTTTPKAYRQAWQHLVKSYRASGDTTAVWVWTPPQTDSIAAYFPGSIYVTWIASNCEMAGDTKGASLTDCYATLRKQVAIQIEMQSKPMLLLVPQVPSVEPYRWALQVAERYPEIKAVVFTPSKQSTK